jgi:hypothetical protein
MNASFRNRENHAACPAVWLAAQDQETDDSNPGHSRQLD